MRAERKTQERAQGIGAGGLGGLGIERKKDLIYTSRSTKDKSGKRSECLPLEVSVSKCKAFKRFIDITGDPELHYSDSGEYS